ncbi:MAG: hypothetical protein KAS17_05900 [Victivallaceae bacterium]|nr:hypothetical protein [Victivallaceae bacterium]
MNKTILFCVVFALSSLNLSALDITTTDGTVYKNVEVTNVLPDAVGFMYTKKDGTPVLRDVKMTLLTKDLQKKFNYSPKKAKAFTKKVNEFQTARANLATKHQKEDLALFRKHKKISKEVDHIKALLHSRGIKCWIHIVRPIGQDCIGKIDMPVSSGKFGHPGTVYVRNLTGPQNERIGTTIYPTEKTKSFEDGMFPVYDANLNKYALQILKEEERSGKRVVLPPGATTTSGKDMIFPANAPKKK